MDNKEQEQRKKSLWSVVYEWAEAVTVAFAVVVLVFAFLFRLVSVDGTSMMSTLEDGQRLILSRFPYTPAYEDIVVISLEEGAEPLIKRIIGLPGDTIEVTDEGAVLRNGEQLTEAYIRVATDKENMEGAVTVPDGMVFVMGDNRARNCSLDSRTFGCISQTTLVGKAVFRVSPLNQWGSLYD